MTIDTQKLRLLARISAVRALTMQEHKDIVWAADIIEALEQQVDEYARMSSQVRAEAEARVKAHIEQHHRDSDTLRKACQQRDDALKQRNALRGVLERCVTTIKRDRDDLELHAIDPKTGSVEDQLTRDDLAKYDALLALAVGRLTRAQD